MKSYLSEDGDGEEPEITSEDNEPPHVYDEPEPVDVDENTTTEGATEETVD